MNYYRPLFCVYSFKRLLLASLVVSFFISVPAADAQQVYDVNITNGSVDVIIQDASTLFNNALDPSNWDESQLLFNGTSPLDTFQIGGQGGTPYPTSETDFQSTSYFAPLNTTSYDPWKTKIGGRNPFGFSNSRYFNFTISTWALQNNVTFSGFNSPLETHKLQGDQNGYTLTFRDDAIKPIAGAKTGLFNYNTFKADILSAIFGADNLHFYIRLITILNATPSTSNFTYHVPVIFGFNSNITIDIPINDILHGTGSWSNFAAIINLFRALMALCYYYAVAVIICRCIFIYN